MDSSADADRILHTSSFWLVPSEENCARLETAIRDLAIDFDAPVFAPHVTLHCIFEDESVLNHLLPALSSACHDVDPFELTISSIGHSEAKFKTLFLEFEPSAPLSALAGALAGRLPSPYVLIPHLSLLYRENLPFESREASATRLLPRFEGLKVKFSSVALVSPGKDRRTFDAIEEWEIIKEVVLKVGVETKN